MNISKSFIPAIEKVRVHFCVACTACHTGQGFMEACEKGSLTGHPIQGVKFILKDGSSLHVSPF